MLEVELHYGARRRDGRVGVRGGPHLGSGFQGTLTHSAEGRAALASSTFKHSGGAINMNHRAWRSATGHKNRQGSAETRATAGFRLLPSSYLSSSSTSQLVSLGTVPTGPEQTCQTHLCCYLHVPLKAMLAS